MVQGGTQFLLGCDDTTSYTLTFIDSNSLLDSNWFHIWFEYWFIFWTFYWFEHCFNFELEFWLSFWHEHWFPSRFKFWYCHWFQSWFSFRSWSKYNNRYTSQWILTLPLLLPNELSRKGHSFESQFWYCLWDSVIRSIFDMIFLYYHIW